MFTNIANNNPVELVYSNSYLNGVRKVESVDPKISSGNFNKLVSTEQKNVSVTEKYDSARDLSAYQSSIQSNTPLAKSKNTNKSFNEKARISYRRYNKSGDGYELSSLSSESTENFEEPVKISGYYIVFNNDQIMSKTDLVKKPLSEIQRRINNIYHVAIKKDPGTLVNLVV